jgi:UDPglucose 6-dehydrogenase
VLGQLYSPLVTRPDQVLYTGVETAELIKYAANSFLAMKVTFINEMADLCEKLGANVKEVAHAIGLDARIGPRFLQPGPGFGGSCFPKDTLALVRIAQEAGAPSRLIEAVVAVNDARKASMSARVIAACGGTVRGRTVAVLGLTFKPDTDDMRDSPSVPIVARLVEDGAIVKVFDPQGMDQARPMLPTGTIYASSTEGALEGVDAVVVVTEWDVFKALTPEAMSKLMSGNVVVDLRNVFDPSAMTAQGFAYHGIGVTPR